MLCSICEHKMHLCKTGERELMENYSLQVSIIGGGIGGLATACALQRQGIQVTVFERNPELREIGAGLTLWANGVQVLRQLGLADALAAVSAPLAHFECWSWRGKHLGSMRLDTIERRVGAPSIGIHRADLLRLLAGEVSRESVHVNAHCVGFRQEQGHVGSGTKKQDMVDSEGNPFSKRGAFNGDDHPTLPSLSERCSGAQ
jgi:2-polyprenyl-6-methoxyphenol hydroxylase-like FAD-dependent oxidoreductase